jgi:flagellar biosynthesis protein
MPSEQTSLTISEQAQMTQEILRLARDYDIPLRQDPALAGALLSLDIGRSLPPELFRAVAEVLAFVAKIEQTVRS